MIYKFKFILFIIICLFVVTHTQEDFSGRVTFVKGSPVLITQAGQVASLRPEYNFGNHSRFRLKSDERVQLFITDKLILKADGSSDFLLRTVGDEVQIIVEYGNFWLKMIDKSVVRWKEYQVSSNLGIFTAQTLVNDVFRVSALDGEVNILKPDGNTEIMDTGERVFIGESLEKVDFGIEAENIKWKDFRKIKPGEPKEQALYQDFDFALPPGQESEILAKIPERRKERESSHPIKIDFSSPEKNKVNVGKTLRVAGRVNTVTVSQIEVYVDDAFLGNIEVDNLMFDATFQIDNPERARFLDCVARDVYGNKAVFTIQLIPSTLPPVITVVPPVNTRKTQMFRGFIEDKSVENVKISLNRGTIFEKILNIECNNGYFEFKISADSFQHDAVPVRYGANNIEIKAVDEFGNTGNLKYTFYIDQDLTDSFFGN
ncbi:MAG: hypothetical protein ACQESP_03205 [Candidatus Muiribacteriota bacterium]